MRNWTSHFPLSPSHDLYRQATKNTTSSPFPRHPPMCRKHNKMLTVPPSANSTQHPQPLQLDRLLCGAPTPIFLTIFATIPLSCTQAPCTGAKGRGFQSVASIKQQRQTAHRAGNKLHRRRLDQTSPPTETRRAVASARRRWLHARTRPSVCAQQLADQVQHLRTKNSLDSATCNDRLHPPPHPSLSLMVPLNAILYASRTD